MQQEQYSSHMRMPNAYTSLEAKILRCWLVSGALGGAVRGGGGSAGLRGLKREKEQWGEELLLVSGA